jgi:hypothetical protein
MRLEAIRRVPGAADFNDGLDIRDDSVGRRAESVLDQREVDGYGRYSDKRGLK